MLDPERVRSVIQTHLPQELTPETLTRFVAEHLLTDPESGTPMVRCTNPERRIFQYLHLKENRWITDTWLYKTLGVIRPLLLEALADSTDPSDLVDFVCNRKTGLLPALCGFFIPTGPDRIE